MLELQLIAMVQYVVAFICHGYAPQCSVANGFHSAFLFSSQQLATTLYTILYGTWAKRAAMGSNNCQKSYYHNRNINNNNGNTATIPLKAMSHLPAIYFGFGVSFAFDCLLQLILNFGGLFIFYTKFLIICVFFYVVHT